MTSWRMALGLILLPVMLHIYMQCMLSRADLFNRVKIGMPYREAKALLDNADVKCNTTARDVIMGATVSPVAVCSFDDPWRDYQVHFEANSDIVAGKSMRFKRYYPFPAREFYYLLYPTRL